MLYMSQTTGSTTRFDGLDNNNNKALPAPNMSHIFPCVQKIFLNFPDFLMFCLKISQNSGLITKILFWWRQIWPIYFHQSFVDACLPVSYQLSLGPQHQYSLAEEQRYHRRKLDIGDIAFPVSSFLKGVKIRPWWRWVCAREKAKSLKSEPGKVAEQ